MTLMIFLYGMIIGSFLNVCIWRVPRGESIIFPPSHCPNCNTRLKLYDLVPVLSYISTGGKCRYCFNQISTQYPLVEVANGLLYLLIFHKYGFSIDSLIYCLLGSLLLVIGIVDYYSQIIPNEFIITGFGILLILNIKSYTTEPSLLLSGVVGLIIAGGFFLFIAIITAGGMGGGDIKLMAMLGLWLGWKLVLLVMLLSFVLGALGSLILISLKIKGRKDYIPFGPFIGIATLLTVLYGDDIINLYIDFALKGFLS
ncbi:prepilin peptidase [Alkaliphilus hydrothermalis]|uniref:Prepilin leader peptidase/N-methyltransferase n=1 Tax=Alkaliphilus hydrothermalis TaxID=1482730 RepID=A0ABS2NM15_9FIRM|nr:A24 family peptidase [Alkaliphilus hydrothermalis]MBM7613985.1 leader peptidase (prepilin peptidase)/N-methyltransferase [Alkaliphilus hydrothermalis]